MLGKLQEAKRMADEIKKKLDDTTLTAEGAGGDIKIEITGNRKFKSISIAPSLQHSDKAEFEKHLLQAINTAIQKADKLNEDEMKKAAGGLMPGML